MKNLTDWFDKVFIINCKHRPDRLATVTKHLTESGMADMSKVTIYPAIIGDYTGHPAGWGGGNGAWGCLKSHIAIFESILHARDERGDLAWDGALILEDDVVFLDGALEGLNAFMEAVPGDWGQIYLGGQHRRKTETTTSPLVSLGTSINRTHAYAVSRGWVHKIYHHISYMADYHSNKHIDHQLELAHQRKDWPVYCPTKWICGQEEGTSNISGRLNERQTWM